MNKKKPEHPLKKVLRRGHRAVRQKAEDMVGDAKALVKHPKDTLVEWAGQFATDEAEWHRRQRSLPRKKKR